MLFSVHTQVFRDDSKIFCFFIFTTFAEYGIGTEGGRIMKTSHKTKSREPWTHELWQHVDWTTACNEKVNITQR